MSETGFKALVARWARRIGVAPERVEVRAMKTKWASCSAAGRVFFSRDLLAESPTFRDSVVVHELLHLRVRNHGKLFRTLLRAHLYSRRVGVSRGGALDRREHVVRELVRDPAGPPLWGAVRVR